MPRGTSDAHPLSTETLFPEGTRGFNRQTLQHSWLVASAHVARTAPRMRRLRVAPENLVRFGKQEGRQSERSSGSNTPRSLPSLHFALLITAHVEFTQEHEVTRVDVRSSDPQA